MSDILTNLNMLLHSIVVLGIVINQYLMTKQLNRIEKKLNEKKDEEK